MHDQVTELAQRGKALLPEDRSRLVDMNRPGFRGGQLV